MKTLELEQFDLIGTELRNIVAVSDMLASVDESHLDEGTASHSAQMIFSAAKRCIELLEGVPEPAAQS